MKDYSKWALLGWLAIGLAILAFEFRGLREADDEWPTLTSLVMIGIKSNWFAAVCIFGLLVWLIIHFAVRIK